MPASNGGTTAPLNLALFPFADSFAIGHFSHIYILDVMNFNDPARASSYSWKVEEVQAGRTPTCSRVILSYTDLGKATITLTLAGSNDAGQIVSETTTLTIGNASPTGKLLTVVVGLSLTAQNLQLTLTRAANAGPVSIVKVRLEGRVETTSYA